MCIRDSSNTESSEENIDLFESSVPRLSGMDIEANIKVDFFDVSGFLFNNLQCSFFTNSKTNFLKDCVAKFLSGDFKVDANIDEKRRVTAAFSLNNADLSKIYDNNLLSFPIKMAGGVSVGGVLKTKVNVYQNLLKYLNGNAKLVFGSFYAVSYTHLDVYKRQIVFCTWYTRKIYKRR